MPRPPEASLPAAQGEAVRVAICVATCRRPDGLRQLLESLNGLVVAEGACKPLVLVVDNDPEQPAAARLGDPAALCRWPLKYRFEAEPGVAAARNRLLALVPDDTDFVAFLDDDETVTPCWLEAMLTTQRESGASAVQGPVRPAFETTPPRWLADVGLFELGPFSDGEPLSFAATNNVLVEKDFLDRNALRFDMRFNRTGGEDEEFFTRFRARGGRIVASSEAVVIDQVPRSRMTWRWVLRRSHRMGNTLGRIALLHGRDRGMRFAKGLGATLFGALRAATAGLVLTRHRTAGLMEIARGTGMLTAFLGVDFAEYSARAMKYDREESA